MGLWLFSAIMAVLTVSAFGCEALRPPIIGQGVPPSGPPAPEGVSPAVS